MKKTLFFMLLLVSITTAQFNLQGLKSIKVEIHDDYGCLDRSTYQKIITETKMRLKSIGIDVNNVNPTAGLQLKIELNTSTAFANPRVNVSLSLIEKVQTFRAGQQRTEALTYHNSSMFEVNKQSISQEIFAFYYDRLLLEFVNLWMQQND